MSFVSPCSSSEQCLSSKVPPKATNSSRHRLPSIKFRTQPLLVPVIPLLTFQQQQNKWSPVLSCSRMIPVPDQVTTWIILSLVFISIGNTYIHVRLNKGVKKSRGQMHKTLYRFKRILSVWIYKAVRTRGSVLEISVIVELGAQTSIPLPQLARFSPPIGLRWTDIGSHDLTSQHLL